MASSYEDLVKEYRQKAKAADKRLANLEKYSGQEFYEHVLGFAYKGAMRDIKSWGGRRRFNTKPPATIQKLQDKIADIDKFMLKPTSSVAQIRQIYIKRAASINKNLGLAGKDAPKWQDWARFWESDVAGKMIDKFGSKTTVILIAMFRKNRKEMIDAIKNANYSRINVEPEFLQSTVEEFLGEWGLQLGDMFFSRDLSTADMKTARRNARRVKRERSGGG